MRKEVLFAIFLGLGLGLIVTYGTYTAKRSLTSRQTTNLTATPTASPLAANNIDLTLASPEDESIQSTKEVRVTGTTKPNSIVTIFIHNQPLVTQADASGNFSVTGNLENGANVIIVRAIDEDGTISEVERTVVFSTIDFDAPVATATATPKVTATPKATPKTTATPKPSPTGTPR
jgi:hypothetical protein